ncbi:hypothetical protein ACGVWS_11315 [Enterobacteriaceae bacterium LUAb1]
MDLAGNRSIQDLAISKRFFIGSLLIRRSTTWIAVAGLLTILQSVNLLHE